MREVHLVCVHGEDLRLGVRALDLQRKQHLLHLAAKAAVAAVEKKIARQLHGDRAGAFGTAMLEDIAIGSPGNPRKVDAPVIFKVLVFDRQDRVV